MTKSFTDYCRAELSESEKQHFSRFMQETALPFGTFGTKTAFFITLIRNQQDNLEGKNKIKSENPGYMIDPKFIPTSEKIERLFDFSDYMLAHCLNRSKKPRTPSKETLETIYNDLGRMRAEQTTLWQDTKRVLEDLSAEEHTIARKFAFACHKKDWGFIYALYAINETDNVEIDPNFEIDTDFKYEYETEDTPSTTPNTQQPRGAISSDGKTIIVNFASASTQKEQEQAQNLGDPEEHQQEPKTLRQMVKELELENKDFLRAKMTDVIERLGTPNSLTNKRENIMEIEYYQQTLEHLIAFIKDLQNATSQLQNETYPEPSRPHLFGVPKLSCVKK